MLTEPDLGSQFGPVLRDGTPVADLIDVERREVSMRLLSDPEIYDLELQRLFGRAWTLLAHETEVPRAGDYVTRYIGADPVIVVRDPQRGLQVMLNVCSHRGMKVCRVEVGNDRQFRCPYHGWIFKTDGAFVGAPIAKEHMHGDVCTKDELGLVHARVETFAGFIFATWDATAPALDDYLGGIKWYLELMFDRTDDGLEVLGSPQRFVIPANWKCAGEQHAGDGYHALSLHRSLQELAMQVPDDDSPAPSMYGVDVSSNGHGLRCIDERSQSWAVEKGKAAASTPLERLLQKPPPGLTVEQARRLPERFDEGQLRVLADFPPQVGGLFPNMGTFSFDFPGPDGMSAIICLHAFVPKAPDRLEFFNWYMVERSAPDEIKDSMSRASALAFGASGFVETDDADTWPQMTDASRGAMGRRQTIKYQALLGERRPDDWPGTGLAYEGFTKDDNQWNWWLRYRDFMVGEPWPVSPELAGRQR
jgi:phenylpropionate dioxygenase-like ring-hydroxylating dioxygenase large terminal subunit